MAAYAALVSLMNDLELIPNHPTHSFSFAQEQISSLLEIVHFFIDFLETYDYHSFGREGAEVLESRIATVAHAAHDVIESHIVDQIHAGSTLDGKATSYFFHDLQKAIEDMDFVKAKATQVKAKRRLGEDEPTYSVPDSLAPLISGKNVVVGFEDVAFQLMDMFIGGSPSLRVIPIVGMGGIGKTTFANYVYENSLIKQHFDVRLRATISQEYSVENIIMELLSGRRSSNTSGNAGELGEKLHKKLWGRRYFIVLDDMWSGGAWDKLRMFLPDDGRGSCVIVTTRLSNLATLLSSSPFEMKLLDEDKSWKLFCGKTFGEEDFPMELEETGKKIVKRCRGLPLSIVVLGGHLRRSSRAIEYWEKVASFMNPILSLGEEEQCLEIIRLSYAHLPAYLKPCFLYLGIFEEDALIPASQLFKCWVAEGFLKRKKSMSLEDVAECYLKDLIDRNLIFIRYRRWNGKADLCGVHDIVRELSLKLAMKEKFICVVEDITQAPIYTERRLVIPKEKQLNSDMINAMHAQSAPQLRCLIHHGGKWFSNELSVYFRLLRISVYVNDVHFNKDGTCSSCAHFQQVNLRYLAFDVHPAELAYSPPSAISACWNLQTLVLMNYDVQVPMLYDIWEMPQLRHLECFQACLPDPLLGERSNQQECIVLRNLHTLLGVLNMRMTEQVCKRMPNIKKLSMTYNHFPNDCVASSYYCPHNLGRFTKLESLRIAFNSDSKWRDVVLGFTFPSSVEELSLGNCHLDWEELTKLIKSFPHLGSLQLSSVLGPEWKLDEEEFRCLKELNIMRCDELTYLDATNSHFPVLESLYISATPKLSEIPSEFGEIPTLQHIDLGDCNISVAVSAMRIVVEQESFGNLDIQVDVSFEKKESLERFQEIMQEEGLTSNSFHLAK